MNRLIVLLCALISISPAVSAQTIFIRVADTSDESFAVFLEATYHLPEGKQANLVTQRAKAIILTSEVGPNGKRAKRTDLQCNHSDKLMMEVQEHRRGGDLEGIMLALDCKPDVENANLLGMIMVASEVRKRGGHVAATCGARAALGTATLAIIPVGHGEVCLEDWSRVRDPIKRFIAEYEKRHANGR
jgi:hypothetical protein